MAFAKATEAARPRDAGSGPREKRTACHSQRAPYTSTAHECRRTAPISAWFIEPAEYVDAFFEHTRPLTDADRAALAPRGVEARAIEGDPFHPLAPIRAAIVLFTPDGTGFIFDEWGEPAFNAAEINEAGDLVDIVAFTLDGSFASWLGRAAILGERSMFAPRIRAPALGVFRDPIEWLANQRAGVVILDPKRARWVLAETSAFVLDVLFGHQLKRALALPEPPIFMEAT